MTVPATLPMFFTYKADGRRKGQSECTTPGNNLDGFIWSWGVTVGSTTVVFLTGNNFPQLSSYMRIKHHSQHIIQYNSHNKGLASSSYRVNKARVRFTCRIFCHSDLRSQVNCIHAAYVIYSGLVCACATTINTFCSTILHTWHTQILKTSCDFSKTEVNGQLVASPQSFTEIPY